MAIFRVHAAGNIMLTGPIANRIVTLTLIFQHGAFAGFFQRGADQLMRGIMTEIVLRLTVRRATQFPLPAVHVLAAVPGIIKLADRAAATAAGFMLDLGQFKQISCCRVAKASRQQTSRTTDTRHSE